MNTKDKAIPRLWERTPQSYKVKSDPLFWHTGIKSGGKRVATVAGIGQEECEASAELIVKAVNNFDSMKRSIEFALQILKSNDENDAEAMPEVVRKLEQSIKQVEEL